MMAFQSCNWKGGRYSVGMRAIASYEMIKCGKYLWRQLVNKYFRKSRITRVTVDSSKTRLWVSLYSAGWPGTHYVDQAGLEFAEIRPALRLYDRIKGIGHPTCPLQEICKLKNNCSPSDRNQIFMYVRQAFYHWI